MDAVLHPPGHLAGEWGEGRLLGIASTTPGDDREQVPHRCQLWALLYNSAEAGAILPALLISIVKEEGEAEIYPGLPES